MRVNTKHKNKNKNGAFHSSDNVYLSVCSNYNSTIRKSGDGILDLYYIQKSKIFSGQYRLKEWSLVSLGNPLTLT